MPDIKVDFNDYNSVTDKLKYVVIVAKYDESLIYVRHKERTTWEIPGGHIEEGESAYEAACREIFEESGALKFYMEEICNYSVEVNGVKSFGSLMFADISEISELPESEIAEVIFSDKMPENLTYPHIQPILLQKVKSIKGF